jgi:hypothetical protein
MYYVNINLDDLDKLQLIKEQQKDLFNNVCCNQQRYYTVKSISK